MTRTLYRFRLAVVCLGLVALAFLQEPGRVAADSKLDLTANPVGFLARALHLWDDTGFSGQVQNQAYGYLWPVGPFFAALDAAQVVAWVAQRLWWSSLLVIGFLGFVRMSRLLGVDSGLARVLAGLSYVLSVRVLTELTVVSVEAWPMALAPWVLIPLIAGSRGGSPRRWAGLSALAFLMTGAINAVASAAILPLGALFLLTRERGSRTLALMAWWLLGIALASLWWVVPLLLLGRYSPPFLDWIEAAASTTGQNDPTSVLRGASHWVPYLVDAQGPVWPAGWQLLSRPVVVAASGLVALLGLAGLMRREIPERAFLVLALSCGIVLTGLGHVSEAGFGGVGAGAVRDLLDAGLAPLRNVHKFQPLVTLPLALGLAHALGAARWAGRRPVPPRVLAPLVATACVSAVAVTAAPALTGGLVGGRSYLEIPGYWREAAAWLNEQDAGRALVVPAASFGVYIWGRTQDEPLQVLDTQSWAVRDAVPLSSAGNIRFLDEVERRLGAGTGSAGLAPALARAGVRWLVVRNDLNTKATRATLPVLVHQALQSSRGITRIATFGPILTSFPSSERIIDGGLLRAYPAVEVYRVAPDPRTVAGKVALRDASSVIRFTGSAEALPDLADSGLLGASAAVSDGDAAPPGANESSVITDTFRRAEANFGAAQRQYSNTLTDLDPFRSDRPVHDYYPVDPTGRLSEARMDGAMSISASSSGGSPFALRGRSPASQPWAALDGDPSTAWISGDLTPGVGQWWQVDFEKPITARSVNLTLVGDTRVGSPPKAIRITTDGGSRDVELGADLDRRVLRLPEGGSTRSLRIELLAVREGGPGQGFGIAEVGLPGVKVHRPVLTAPSDADGGIVLAARSMGRESCVATDTAILCDPALADPGEERSGIDRVVDVGVGGEYRIETVLRPRPGSALDAYLGAPDNAVRVESSSQVASDPAVRAQAAADQNRRTTWIASPLDREPTLEVRLPARQRVSGVLLQTAPDAPASRPLRVTVDINGVTMTLYTDRNGRLDLPDIVTDELLLRFGAVNPIRSIDSGTGASVLLPVGVTELVLQGGPDRRMLQAESEAVPIPCGFGPEIHVDGDALVETRIDATVGGILEGSLAQGHGCEQTVRLAPGVHRIRVEPTAEWTVERVYLIPAQPAAEVGDDRFVPPRVLQWSAATRVVAVDSGETPRLLELTENFNAGWSARLEGSELAPYRVDGWRQAFLIPAGAAGEVEISYAPDATYRRGLLIGLVAALLLLVLTVIPARRAPSDPVGPARLRRTVVVAPLTAAVLVGGAWAALSVGVVVGAALLLARRRTAGDAVSAARAMGLTGAAAALLGQAVWTWPARVEAGAAYQALLIVGPAMALGALAVVATVRLDVPTAGSASPGPPS